MSKEEWLPLATPAAIVFLGISIFATGTLVSMQLDGLNGLSSSLRTVATDGLKVDHNGDVVLKCDGPGYSTECGVRLSGSLGMRQGL